MRAKTTLNVIVESTDICTEKDFNFIQEKLNDKKNYDKIIELIKKLLLVDEVNIIDLNVELIEEGKENEK